MNYHCLKYNISFSALLFAVLLVVLQVSPSHAKLEVCNETGEARDVAIGYKGKDGWTSEGWWTVKVDECRTLIKTDLKRKFYYYRAQHKGGDFDGERYNFCTQSEPFTIVGDDDCKSRGYKVSEFRQIELMKGVIGFRLTLDDSTIYSEDRKSASSNAGKSSDSSKTSPAPAQDVASSAGPDAPAGTHGEPYTITGTFSGCDFVDGLLWCNFEADGWQYVVKDDGKSHTHILNEIDGLTIGDSYTISGDLMFYSDASRKADVTVRTYERAGVGAAGGATGAAPGLYGDPYNVIGIFRGCSHDFGEFYCTFDAQDAAYVIGDDGKTPNELLNEVTRLELNRRFLIEGDMMEFGDVSVAATLRNYQPTQESAAQVKLNGLIGLWTSKDDPSYTMRITFDGRRYDYSEGNLSWDAKLSFTTQCDDLQVPSTGTELLQANGPDGPEDVLCYEVIESNQNKLTLMYLPRGNFLEFEKLEGAY